MSKVCVRNISKRFGNAVAVDNITLEFPDRQLTVLVGSSGCGKTTLLRMLAGLEEPTEGEIFIGDKEVAHVPAWDRNIAMVFQSYALYPHMTVFKNIAFPLEARRTPRKEIKRRVQETAEILGLTELLDRLPRQLSGGQMQRVAIGRAIVRRPDVFLMDEPLSNLDAKLRVSMRAELKRLAARPGRDDGLRDARPGRGHDAGRSTGGDERGACLADRHIRKKSTCTRRASSSPASSGVRA